MPTISIIVPVYQVEAYLGRCIDSILSQSYEDYELILVDDGSPDRCGEICEEYAKKDPRIRVIHKENGGLSTARNAGLDCASGSFVTFCDSDDYWQPDWLEWLYSAATKQNADMTNGGLTFVDSEGAVLELSDFPEHVAHLNSSQERAEHYFDILDYKYGWSVCTTLFRMTPIREQNIRFCESCENFAEDLCFVLENLLYAKTTYTGSYNGYYYFIRSGSIVQSSKNAVMLNAMNEVSKQFGLRMKRELPELYSSHFPLMHFLIMYNQYVRLLGKPGYPRLPAELNKIRDKRWFRKQTRGLYRCSKLLKARYGKGCCQKLLFFSHFCLHKSWRLFRRECKVFYRWIYKGD